MFSKLYLKKIEIYGFKSFADRTDLFFDNGITTIVGPNGSGKSNIADAVRWVLGEQSAKTLRGGKMEDIIFNGTEKRKPVGFAEVSLTLENSDKALRIEFTEVTITRRIFRSGESEYYINRAGCRLKDILELFMDTGIGKEGYSIIGQGRIDEILGTRSEDRRAVFEEAAGVVKYKVRKLESEKKLDQTNQNLLRLEDIVEELTLQLGPLNEQSETAKRYMKMQEKSKHLEINFFLYQYHKIKIKMNDATQTLSSLNALYEQKNSFFSKLESLIEKNSMDTSQLHQEINSIQKQTYETNLYIQNAEGEYRVLQEQVNYIHKENIKTEIEITQVKEQHQDLKDRRTTIQSKLEMDDLDIENAEKYVSQQNDEIVHLSAILSQMEIDLESSQTSIIDSLNQLSDLKSNLVRYDTLKVNVCKRLDEVQNLMQKIRSQKAMQEQVEQDSLHHIDLMIENKMNLIEQRHKIEEALVISNQQLQMLNEKLKTDHANIQTLISKLAMLTELKKDYDGFQLSVKHIMLDTNVQKDIKERICGVIAEMIQVPHEFEKAIETSLGPSLQYIVTETPQESQYLIEYLRKNRYGRATFLPLTAIKGRNLHEDERKLLSQKGIVGIASDLIGYDPKYKEIFSSLLSRTVIVDNLDIAIALAKRSRYGFRIATLEGDIINTGGSMTGGSMQSKFSSILGRGREITETNENLTAFQVKYKQLMVQIENMNSNKKKIEEQLSTIQTEMHKIEIDHVKEFEQLKKIRENIQIFDIEIVKLGKENEQLQVDLDDLDTHITHFEKQQIKLETQNSGTQRQVLHSQENIDKLKREKEVGMQELTSSRIQLVTLRNRYQNHIDEKQQIEKELMSFAENINSKRIEYENNDDKIVELTNCIENQKQKMENHIIQLDNLNRVLQDKQLQRETIVNEVKTLEADKKGLQVEISDCMEKRYRIELQIAKLDVDLENLQNHIWDDYEISYRNALPYQDDQLVAHQLSNDIAKIKKEIKELGNINVNAIEEYKKLQERHSFLQAQCSDLIQAQIHLRGIISELLSMMETQFRQQFVLMNENFNQVFQKLFNGGKAELILQNETDILNCGIEINAQPPGKKLQSLLLLSGGERALTAIALLFAILDLKPTPFCLLDEIEATLDDTNINNFAHYLQEYAQKTQFVIITHRKGTMEASNTLYGISMEEKGISRMISVKLSEKVG